MVKTQPPRRETVRGKSGSGGERVSSPHRRVIVQKVGCFPLQSLTVHTYGECQRAEYCPEGKRVN